MATIVTRSGKGSPLTNTEVDANFTNLNDDKAELSGANFTGSIDVTGTVTADGLTVDGDAKIKTGGPARGLLVGVDLGNSDSGLYYEQTGKLHLRGRGGYSLEFNTAATAGTNLKRMDIASNGDISFYEDTGTTPKFFWDASAESLGIGTSSPSASNGTLVIGGVDTTNNNPQGSIAFQDGGNSGQSRIRSYRGFSFQHGQLAFEVAQGTLNSYVEAMRIDSSGRVGIGTSSPATALDVTGTVTADGLTVESSDNATGAVTTLSNTNTSTDSNTVIGVLIFENNDVSAGAANAEIKGLSSGTNGQTDLYIRTGSSGTLYNRAKFDFSGDISFYEDTGTSAKFFWDASAESLGIGTASPNTILHIKNTSGNNGIRIETASTDNGFIHFADADDDNIGRVVYSHSDNSMQFVTSDAEAMRIDASGNVGIGTTSPDGTLHVKGEISQLVLENKIESIGAGTVFGQITFLGDDNSDPALDATAKTEIRVVSESAWNGNSLNYNSSITFAPTYQATPVERMRITSAGNVGIGTTSPNAPLQVKANGTTIALQPTSDTDNSIILFRNAADTSNAGAMYYDHTNDAMVFWTNGNTERMRIDSSGNLLVGTTTTLGDSDLAGGETGFAARSNGLTIASRDSGTTLIANRGTTDGDIAVFQKDGTTVGSIGNNGTGIYFGRSDSNIGVNLTGTGGNSVLVPSTASGALNDNSIDLGASTARWKDLYLSGGVYLGGTGAANLLDDYEEGTWTPTYEGDTTNPTVTYDSFTSGRYTKIGNIVIATFTLRTDSVTGGSGDLKVGGLPFTVVNAAGKFNTGAAILSQTNSFGGNFPLEGIVRINSTEMSLVYRTAVNGAQSPMDVSDLGTGANANVLVMTVIYEAA